jgi:formate/nitrite transporter
MVPSNVDQASNEAHDDVFSRARSRKQFPVDVRNAGKQVALTVHPPDYHLHEIPIVLDAFCPASSAVSPAALSQSLYLDSLLHGGFASTYFQFNDASSLSHYFITTGIAKAHSAIWPRFVAGVLAGLFVVLGTLFALVAAGGISEELRADHPAIPKLLTGATFPIAIVLILIVGGDLFTGDCMYMGLACFTGRVSLRQVTNVLIVSFCSNLCGCLFFSYFLGYCTDLFIAEPYSSWMMSVATAKVNMDWGVVVLRAIGANTLVCISIFLCSASRDALGRLVLAWLPVAVFAVTGLEHVVANMASIPIAMMYGTPFTARQYIARSMIPAALGNIMGGVFLVGGFLTYMYCWQVRRHTSWSGWLTFNFIPTSTWREVIHELRHQLFTDLPIYEAKGVDSLAEPAIPLA